jgi:hypothetical protein
MVTPAARREAVAQLRVAFEVSERGRVRHSERIARQCAMAARQTLVRNRRNWEKKHRGTKMSQITQLATQVLIRGRPLKFTPERIQQIKNLVERGKRREEIAELIGVTIGSLQVTCSRLGISLRRPTFNTGAGSQRRDEPRSNGVSTPSPSRGGDSALLQSSKERAEQNSRSGPVEQAPMPWEEWAKRANEAGFAIKMRYRGEERTTELPLTQDMIGQLAFEAAFRNVTIGEFIGQLIIAVADKGLLQTVLEYKKP